jgi:hypothetical protein
MWRKLKADVVVRILIEGGQRTTEASLAYVGLLSISSWARTNFPEQGKKPRSPKTDVITFRFGIFGDCESRLCEYTNLWRCGRWRCSARPVLKHTSLELDM